MFGFNNKKLPPRFQCPVYFGHESGNIRRMVHHVEGKRKINLTSQVIDFKTAVTADARVDTFQQPGFG